MRPLKLLPFVLIIATGCSKHNEATIDSTSAVKAPLENKQVFEYLKTPSTGRWLVNNLHCDNQIDIRKSSEITITEVGVNRSGYSLNSGWKMIEKSNFESTIDKVAENLIGCLEFDNKSLKIAKVTHKSEEVILAFDDKQNALLRIYDNNAVDILVPFNSEILKSYDIIDSLSEEPLAYDPYTDE